MTQRLRALADADEVRSSSPEPRGETREPERPRGRDLVVYSGGPDSTLILDLFAQTPNSETIALTVDRHNQIEEKQLEGQRRAQMAYLQWAPSHGRVFQHVRLEVLGPNEGGLGVVAAMGQPTTWLAAILPYVADGDRVHFGYLKGDDFWHSREKFDRAFEAFCAMKEVKATLVYDLEWMTKIQVVQGLQNARIPTRCVWTCDEPNFSPTGPVQCGRCGKCQSLLEACAAVPPRPKKDGRRETLGGARKARDAAYQIPLLGPHNLYPTRKAEVSLRDPHAPTSVVPKFRW